MGMGPLTSSTGRWVTPTALGRPDLDHLHTEVHAVTDGLPICGTWVNTKVLTWSFEGHGYVLDRITCSACRDLVQARTQPSQSASSTGSPAVAVPTQEAKP